LTQELTEAITVYRFCDAPADLRALSTHGGDEDWVVVLPPSFAEDPPDWLTGHGFGNGWLPDLMDHPTLPGWKVCIGAHA